MGSCDRGGARERGVSFPELMVVIALLGLAVAVTVPIVAGRIHELRLRSAADRFVMALRAQRMMAVTSGKPTAVIVHGEGPPSGAVPDPHNSYAFADRQGRLACDSSDWDPPMSAPWPWGAAPQCTRVELPPGVWIEPESTPVIGFLPNGALASATPATTVLRARLAGQLETWTVTTARGGIPVVAHESGAAGGSTAP
jgi:prepilin-type N-terminal cleavage/methylation domain-containing protein